MAWDALTFCHDAPINSPELSTLLPHPAFASGLRDALSRVLPVVLCQQSIGCFVQDNRQKVLKFPDAAGIYQTRPQHGPGAEARGAVSETCPPDAVKLSLFFPLLFEHANGDGGDLPREWSIVVVPFDFEATGPSHPLSAQTLSYASRIDLLWQRDPVGFMHCRAQWRYRSAAGRTLAAPRALDLKTFCRVLETRWQEVNRAAPQRAPVTTAGSFDFPKSEKERLMAAIASIQRSIAAGDCYLANLTTVVETPAVQMASTFDVFLGRWGRNTSRFGWFVQTPDLSIESYSPERFFSIDGMTIRTEPIKGTLPVVGSAGGERAAAEALWQSEKERCEQHLVTDLLRNDLLGVCNPGSVRVTSPLDVRICSGLAQMTTVIEGRLTSATDLRWLLDRLLPAGSITGTPKLAVCNILRKLEPQQRTSYCGLCIDAASPTSLEATLLIRSLFRLGSRMFAGVGAGITALSDPAAEVREMERKLASFLGRCAAGEARP